MLTRCVLSKLNFSKSLFQKILEIFNSLFKSIFYADFKYLNYFTVTIQYKKAIKNKWKPRFRTESDLPKKTEFYRVSHSKSRNHYKYNYYSKYGDICFPESRQKKIRNLAG